MTSCNACYKRLLDGGMDNGLNGELSGAIRCYFCHQARDDVSGGRREWTCRIDFE